MEKTKGTGVFLRFKLTLQLLHKDAESMIGDTTGIETGIIHERTGEG
jgi:hypothetical protein